MQLTGRTLQFFAGATGSLCLTTVGINVAWTSPYLSTLTNTTTSPVPMSSEDASWCAVIHFFGVPLGCLAATYLVDRIGRKLTILTAAPFTFLSFICIAYANSLFLLLMGRLVIGSCHGVGYTMLAVYLAEISDPEIRGSISTMMTIFFQIGVIFINAVGPLVTIFTSSFMAAAITALHMLTFSWVPKSPYYLIKSGRYNEAKNSLRLLRGRNNVQIELQEISVAVARQEGNSKGKFADLFTIRSNRRALMIQLIVNLTQLFSGASTFAVYTSKMFETPAAHVNPSLSSVIYSLLGILGYAAASRFIDKYGRRFMVLFSSIGCALVLCVLGFYYYLQTYVQFLTWLPMIAFLSFQIIYTLGIGTIEGILMGELFPSNIKGKATCFVESMLALGNVYVTQFFFVLSVAFDLYVSFWTFSLSLMVMTVILYRYLIETSCKTLDEIQLKLEEE